MLTTLGALLVQAQREKKAIGAFNVYNMETVLAVIHAARQLRSPVIISFGEGYFKHAPVAAIGAVVKEICSDLTIPVVLHLDHAKELTSIAKAIRAGFTSVMYDGSLLPLEDNIRRTKQIVEYAHAAGVSVEGELGYLNPEDGSFEPGLELAKGYTRVEDARRYVAESGIDALAVAVGNAHGLYKGIPTLDFERLAAIRTAIDIPLVLHGCSGIPDEALQTAVRLGVSKFNVNTEVSLAAVAAVRQFLTQHPAAGLRFEAVLAAAQPAMEETIARYIRLLANGA